MSAAPFTWFKKKPPPPKTGAELYRAARTAHQEAYDAVREVTLSLVYLRQRLEAEAYERRSEIARLHDEARRLARRGADEAALQKLLDKQAHRSALLVREERLEEVKAQAERAKNKLTALGLELRNLEAELLEARALERATDRWERIERLELEVAELTRAAKATAAPRPLLRTVPDLDEDLTSARLDLALLKKS